MESGGTHGQVGDASAGELREEWVHDGDEERSEEGEGGDEVADLLLPPAEVALCRTRVGLERLR